MSAPITPKVAMAADMLRRFSREELSQLVAMVPNLRDVPLSNKEVVAHFRQRGLAQRAGREARVDDLFVGGLTYTQYFSMSEEEQDAFWQQLFAEGADDMEVMPEADVTTDANMSA